MSELEFNPERRIALFQRKEIRRLIHNQEWWFVINDVVASITDSADPGDYLKKLRKRDLPLGEAFKGGGQLVPPLGLEFETAGGRQLLQCLMLGEAGTTEIARNRDAQGFPQNRQAAHEGGKVAGNARRELEKKSGRKVVTSENYLALTQSAKGAKRVKG